VIASSTMTTWPAVSKANAATDLASADDAALIGRYLRTDDEQIFEILVRRYQDKVFRLATSILGHRAETEAEDATQEAFIAVLRQIRTFRRESKFSTWLYRVARNQIIDYSRRAARRSSEVSDEVLQTAPDDGVLTDPQRAVTTAQKQALLLRCIDRLSEPQRAALRLHYWHGESVAEISELLGLGPSTVRSHLFRARQRLALLLREDRLYE
jgi:RNA polymerase sigma-70 factor (ECF subfamily)